MKTKILEVLNKRDGKYEDGIYYMFADEMALNELSEELNDLFALRSVDITFKEKIEKEIVELREELAKLLNDKLSAYTSIDDWSDKIAFITGKIEGLKSALN